MSAEIIPIKRSHMRKDGWREQLRQEPLGSITSFLERFTTHLQARPAAPTTVDRYLLAARQLADFLDDPDVSTIQRADIERFIVYRMGFTTGSTVAGTFVALCQFFKFVALEVSPDPFTAPTEGMTTPAFEPRIIEVPDGELLAAVIRHAQAERDHTGARTYEGIRDEAILRMFVDTGARLAEITKLSLQDNLGDRIRLTGKSKGRGPVERTVCLSSATQTAFKRYLRHRGGHPGAQNMALWLGRKGPLTTSGVRQMVWRRSQACGMRIHPHQFRHAFAHGWKSTPGQHDGDLMEIMGWRTEAMLHRYGKAAAAQRALNAHQAFLEQRSR